MKTLKIFGAIVGTIVGVIFIVALFLPSQVSHKENLIIDADPVAIFNGINNIKKWKEWSPWFDGDPEIQITYSGPEKGKHASMKWNGPVSGTGSLTITESIPFKKIEYELSFYDQELARGKFIIQPQQKGTRVEWYIELDSLEYPVGRWTGLLLPLTVQDDFRKGLKNMETFLLK